MVPSGDSGFVISSDASSSGLVCVLMQNGKVIAYAPRKLKNHERNTYSWLGVGYSYICIKNLEALLIWCLVWDFYRS